MTDTTVDTDETVEYDADQAFTDENDREIAYRSDSSPAGSRGPGSAGPMP